MPVISVFVKLRRDDHEFKDSLNYVMRLYQKKKESIFINYTSDRGSDAHQRSFFLKYLEISAENHNQTMCRERVWSTEP